MIDLFTSSILFLNLTLISTAWFATGMMFYGLSIYMPEFKSTDIRLITFLLGLAEIPADMVPIVALNRCGRRYNSIFNYLMGGTVCIITAFIPVGYYIYEWPIVLLALLGKYASQVSFGICYIYTAELFPTVVRNNAVAMASMS